MSNTTAEFNEAFATFLGYALTVRLAYFSQNGFTFATPTVEIEPGDKFIKIVHADSRDGKNSHHSAVAFVATRDFSNRGLGDVKAGDVFKSASYKAPAKHARGNIFAPDNGCDCYGHNGPHYLR